MPFREVNPDEIRQQLVELERDPEIAEYAKQIDAEYELKKKPWLKHAKNGRCHK